MATMFGTAPVYMVLYVVFFRSIAHAVSHERSISMPDSTRLVYIGKTRIGRPDIKQSGGHLNLQVSYVVFGSQRPHFLMLSL